MTTELGRVPSAPGSRHRCKAQYAMPEPQDCDWPFCGCDPHANRVLEALQESGYTIVSDYAPDGEALTAASDNVLMWRMGEACNAASKASAGDYIDRGLALLRELNERGLAIVLAEQER